MTQALEAFATGQLDLAEVRQIMMIALQEDQTRGEAIHELLDEALTAESLSISDYGELISALGSVGSENVPTEASADAPDESGVYKVMDAGAMVRAERSRGRDAATPASAAGSGIPDDSEFTKPLVLDDDAPSGNQQEVGAGYVLRQRFRLEEQVASGSMGVVYRATDLMKLDAEAADPRLAIKLVSPRIANNTLALRAFQGEVANTQHLSHPNIVQLYDLDRDGDTIFITMEWLEGESLAAALDRSRNVPLPDAQVCDIAQQLSSALSYAHEHGVIHADVKPGNVFLTAAGATKLIDFGVARSVGSLGDERSAGLTPVYASCERLEQAPPTPHDDLYSLACVIYRMLTGRRVFGSLTALEAEQRGMEPQPVGSISGAAWQALRQALAFRAADRQPDVARFARDFLGATSADRVDPHTLSMPPELADVFDDAVAAQSGPQQTGAGSADQSAATELEPLDIEWELPEVDPEPAEAADGPAAATAPALAGALHEPPPGAAPRPAAAADTAPGSTAAPSRYRWVVISVCLIALIGAFAVLNPRSPVLVTERRAPAALNPAVDSATPSRADAPAAPARVPDPVAELPQPEPPLAVAVAPAEPPAVTELDAATALPPDVAAAAAPPPEPAATPAAAPPPPAAVEPEPEVLLPSATAALSAEAAVSAPAAAAPSAAADDPLGAAAAELTTPQAAEPETVQEPTQLELLLSLETAARLSLTDGRLESPLRDNAVYYVDKMRAIDPAAPLTLATAAELGAAFTARAEEALDAGGAERALNALDMAEQFAAPEQLTAPLRRQAEALSAEYAAAAAAAAEAAAEAAAAGAAAAAPVFDPNEPVALRDLEFKNFVEPRYPRRLDRNYSGWVDMEFSVDANGRTTEVVVVDMNLPDAFAEPSLDAVREWRFEPYEFAGEAVAVRSAVRLRFEN